MFYENCKHLNIINEKGSNVCIDCGEIQENFSCEKDCFYENGNTEDTLIYKTSTDKSIFKDVDSYGFSESIVSEANRLYANVTKGAIYRGGVRTGIIFACIYVAYQKIKKPQSHDKLKNIFNIDSETCNKGLLFVRKNLPTITVNISHTTIIEEIMTKFSATKEQIGEVNSLYDKIKNKSSLLNRSRLQSVSCGLIYYWICKKNKNISLSEFSKKVCLGNMTIDKIKKEITDILEK
jgi:transcription initiation factor TFIIIB Brf1 subunit/transcription initiation factor TFIIB